MRFMRSSSFYMSRMMNYSRWGLSSNRYRLTSRSSSAGSLLSNRFGFDRTATKYAHNTRYGSQQSVANDSIRASQVRMPSRVRTTGVEDGKTRGEQWDKYLEDVKAQAKKDASAGVYMGDDFHKLETEYRDKYVSPDRSKATAEADKIVRQTPARSGEAYYRMAGSSYTVGIQKGYRSSSEVYNQNGEVIARKQGSYGSWTKVTTKAENYASQETSRIYNEAYRAARMDTRGVQQVKDNSKGMHLDVRA